MAAGVEAFAERGYHATTTRDIAARAGVSAGALYVHFRSKEELLHAICRRGHERALALVGEAVAGADGPEARLRAYVRTFTSWHAREHLVARVVQDELDALDPEHFAEVAARRRELEHLLRGIVEDGVAAGAFAVDDVPAVALAVLSLGIDVARWSPRSPGRSPEQVGDLYADLAVRMVRA
nr:TetR/AcrR family transcriptional regulator [Vallicoccus soli]